jgi:hypothetical protein
MGTGEVSPGRVVRGEFSSPFAGGEESVSESGGTIAEAPARGKPNWQAGRVAKVTKPEQKLQTLPSPARVVEK